MEHTEPLIAGNWKMNLSRSDAIALVEDLAEAALSDAVELAICPPAPLIWPVADRLSALQATDRIGLGGQDCHARLSGAHTGDISVSMLAEAGCRYVVLGHSERRADHGESDSDVRAKALTVQAFGLSPLVCVGETLEARESGQAESVVGRQLAGSLPDLPERLCVAYEPVWAIGTGRTATATDIETMHRAIRAALSERYGDAGKAIRVLYGGSVKPGNAKEILAVPDVGGVLVGGASLLASDFLAIAAAVPA